MRWHPGSLTAAALSFGFAFTAPAVAQDVIVVTPETPRPESGTLRIEPAEDGRIHVDAMDADLRQVLRQMAQAANANLLLDDEVQGRVTLRLRDVRFADALDAVLQTNGLAAEIDGNIVRVAPVAKLSQEWTRRTQVRQQWEASAPLETRVVPLDYADPETVIPLVRDMLSPRGSVSYDPRTRSIIIRDVQGSDALGF